MDEIGVSLPHNSPISTHQIQKRLWDLTPGVQFRESGICVSLWSEVALKRLWDLALGVLFREICGICVRLWCEAAVEHLWDLASGVQT